MAEILDTTPSAQGKPRISGASGDPARPAYLRLVQQEPAPVREPVRAQSPILRCFRRLVAAICIAGGADAEASGAGWDLACSDWQAESEAAWDRVQRLSAFLGRQFSSDLEDASLLGAARLIHAAVTCDTGERLFELREQMHVIRDVCRTSGRGGRFSAHAHLLAMAAGLLEDMCDRLLSSEEAAPEGDEEDLFPLP
ncbi:MAG: hypothetical protein KGI94_10035 [Paracoccaceae bacterium]|nr:hypothetical protein [Paracoccaceae bacterium]